MTLDRFREIEKVVSRGSPHSPGPKQLRCFRGWIRKMRVEVEFPYSGERPGGEFLDVPAVENAAGLD